MLPAGSSWKRSAKALWQVIWSIWMLAALIVWPSKTFKFLSMLMTGHYPDGFLMLVHLLEIDWPLVALMPFWSLPYLLKNTKRLSLLICTRFHTQDKPAKMNAEFTSSFSTWGRYTSLRYNTVKIHGLDTNWRPLENNTRFFVSAWRPKKLSFTPFFLVWEALSIPHTLWIISKSSALIYRKPTRLSSNDAHFVLYAHKLTTTRRALEKSRCSQGLGMEQGAACHPPDPH